jgi:histidinol-phosphate/aromatic aminotransferase/cobyric acid decarboxylase-like protein
MRGASPGAKTTSRPSSGHRRFVPFRNLAHGSHQAGADSLKRRCLIQALPTYPCLGQFARSVGVNVIDVSLNKRFEHDLDAMLKHAAKENAFGLIYICNPNNPTGTLTERADIEAFVHKLPHSFIVLIDEAYSHFVSPHTAYASFLDKPVNVQESSSAVHFPMSMD